MPKFMCHQGFYWSSMMYSVFLFLRRYELMMNLNFLNIYSNILGISGKIIAIF